MYSRSGGMPAAQEARVRGLALAGECRPTSYRTAPPDGMPPVRAAHPSHSISCRHAPCALQICTCSAPSARPASLPSHATSSISTSSPPTSVAAARVAAASAAAARSMCAPPWPAGRGTCTTRSTQQPDPHAPAPRPQYPVPPRHPRPATPITSSLLASAVHARRAATRPDPSRIVHPSAVSVTRPRSCARPLRRSTPGQVASTVTPTALMRLWSAERAALSRALCGVVRRRRWPQWSTPQPHKGDIGAVHERQPQGHSLALRRVRVGSVGFAPRCP